MIRIPKLHNRTSEMLEKRAASASTLKVSAAAADGSVDVMLYDEIGYFGTSAKMFCDALAQVDAKTINLRINSPGGDVFDGIAMYNAVKKHPANVVAHVEGLAASAASIVLMAANQVRMNQGSFLMIHNVWTIMAGNADEMRELADMLDKVDTSIAGIYAAKTGRKADIMQSFMDDETWFDAQEAVDEKFADGIDDAPAAKADFDLTIYNHVPAKLKGSSSAHPKPQTVRDLEGLLRDAAGMSAPEAKAFIANMRSPRLRDEDLSGIGAVIKSFQK